MLEQNKRRDLLELIREYTNEDLTQILGVVKLKMLLNEDKNSSTHFVCPITYKVLSIQASVKIVTEYKETKTQKQTSWYYLSKKAYNQILKKVKR